MDKKKKKVDLLVNATFEQIIKLSVSDKVTEANIAKKKKLKVKT